MTTELNTSERQNYKVEMQISGYLDKKDVARLKKLGFRIDWSTKTVTGELYWDQIRVHNMIIDGHLVVTKSTEME